MRESDQMSVAMPVLKNQGLASRVSRHFGKAPGFILSDPSGTKWEYVDSKSVRKPDECAPISALAERGCQAIFCQNMGQGALEKCRKAGLMIYQTQGDLMVSEVMAAFKSGRRTELPESALCHHEHGQCDDHNHGAGHEH